MLIRLLIWLTAVLAVVSGCADNPPPDSAALPSELGRSDMATGSSPTSPTATADSAAAITLADGVVLRPGVDGRLPVKVRWTYQGGAPEGFAVDRRRGLLYLDDELATALKLSDGSIVWQVGSPPNSVLEGGLASDGGDVIGPTSRGGVRFFAPYNFDITVNPETGKRTAFRYVPGALPRALTPFPRPRTRNPRVNVGLDRVVARSPVGRIVWRITVRSPMLEHAGPVAVPGGVAFLLSTGLVVVLDWTRPR